jgi:hypothetical protein
MLIPLFLLVGTRCKRVVILVVVSIVATTVHQQTERLLLQPIHRHS